DSLRRANPLRVLYAESELQDIEYTRRHFAVNADHLRLSTVASGSEFLKVLQQDQNYDVLLLDLHTSELNALELLRELRLTLKIDLPTVLLCQSGDEELARQGLKLGASTYVLKAPGYLYELPLQIEEAHSRAAIQRREAALQTSEARNRALLNAIPDVMFLLTRDGIYLDYHAKEKDLLLVPPEHFLGRNVSEVMP